MRGALKAELKLSVERVGSMDSNREAVYEGIISVWLARRFHFRLDLCIAHSNRGLVFCRSLATGAKPEKKSEPVGPKQTESDTVIGPKKQAPPKKKRISPKKPTGDKPDENFTLAVDIELVNLDVVVTDKRGNFIPNLTQKNFRVYEDKVEQKVTNFSPTAAPITIVMLVEFANTLAFWYDDVITPTAGFIELLQAR